MKEFDVFWGEDTRKTAEAICSKFLFISAEEWESGLNTILNSNLSHDPQLFIEDVTLKTFKILKWLGGELPSYPNENAFFPFVVGASSSDEFSDKIFEYFKDDIITSSLFFFWNREESKEDSESNKIKSNAVKLKDDYSLLYRNYADLKELMNNYSKSEFSIESDHAIFTSQSKLGASSFSYEHNFEEFISLLIDIDKPIEMNRQSVRRVPVYEPKYASLARLLTESLKAFPTLEKMTFRNFKQTLERFKDYVPPIYEKDARSLPIFYLLENHFKIISILNISKELYYDEEVGEFFRDDLQKSSYNYTLINSLIALPNAMSSAYSAKNESFTKYLIHLLNSNDPAKIRLPQSVFEHVSTLKYLYANYFADTLASEWAPKAKKSHVILQAICELIVQAIFPLWQALVISVVNLHFKTDAERRLFFKPIYEYMEEKNINLYAAAWANLKNITVLKEKSILEGVTKNLTHTYTESIWKNSVYYNPRVNLIKSSTYHL